MVQFITTPNGEKLAILPKDAFDRLAALAEDMEDIAAANAVMARVRSGEEDVFPASVVNRLLNGENTVKVFREHRGMTQAQLAATAGINAVYLSQKTDIAIHFPKGRAVRTRNFTGTSIAPRPDYAMLMQAYGGQGEVVEKPAEVRPALLRGLAAIARGQAALIDMRLAAINGDA